LADAPKQLAHELCERHNNQHGEQQVQQCVIGASAAGRLRFGLGFSLHDGRQKQQQW
jgi:hypothetical protein